jgi:spermidine synthase
MSDAQGQRESDPHTNSSSLRDAPSLRALASMASVAGSGILLQLSLTRLFSLVVWYHFAFLAIAVAMLGLSVGGWLAARRSAANADDPARDAAVGAAGAGASILVLLLALPRMPFYQSIFASVGQFALYVLLVTMVLAPFTGIGFAISRILGAAKKEHTGALYGADLAGSGLSGALAVVAMDHLGGGAGGCAVAGLLASVAAVGFGREALSRPDAQPVDALPRWKRPSAAIALAVLCASYSLLARDPMHPVVYARNAKLFPRVERQDTIERRCTSIACVDFFRNPLHLGMWGREGVDSNLPEQVGIVIDGWAITSILRGTRGEDGRTRAEHPMFDRLPTAFAQQLRRVARTPTANTLVIGAGGGLDVRAALHYGVQEVDAVEINPVIVGGVRGRFAEFSGDLFRDPRVRLVLGEGRSVLERLTTRYDLVQLSGVDTYAASQAGAFALTENYLYTVEALRAYLDRLTPGGTLTLTRWLYHPDRQTIRLVATIDEATHRAGLGDAGPRTFIAATPAPGSDMDFSMVVVMRRPFTADELRRARLLSTTLGYRVAWSPDAQGGESPFREYFAAGDLAARRRWLSAYSFRVEPTTDDAPFFFEHTRLAKLFSSRDQILGSASGQLVLIVSALLVSLLGALILWAARRDLGEDRLGPRRSVYFVALGVGYLAVETAMIPRVTQFLGYPTYALTVVLSSLLVGSGIGSALSPRWKLTPRSATAMSAAVVATVALGLPSLLRACAQWSLEGRIAIASLTVGLVGMALGTPFPTGLTAMAQGRSSRALEAWVINGVASSVAGVLALVVAIERGFTAILWASAAAYAIAAIAANRTSSLQDNPQTPHTNS